MTDRKLHENYPRVSKHLAVTDCAQGLTAERKARRHRINLPDGNLLRLGGHQWRHLSILTFAVGLSFVTTTTAEEPGTALGRKAFVENCAICHGADARGETPAANGGIAAPDLTVLATGNGGSFPRDRVHRLIDGRNEQPAHGGPMPAWGLLLSSAGGGAMIDHLVDYIASIQANSRD